MRCNQCHNNAIGEFGPQRIPLCLSCYSLLQSTLNRQNEALKEEINYLSDSIDSMFGIRSGARYPTKHPVVVSGPVVNNNNHISINNSPIGVLNTGNITNLNQTIDSLNSASHKELAENVKNFSQVVLTEDSISDDKKTEILENLDVITKEMYLKPESRKKSVVKTLAGNISGLVEFSANAFTAWQVLHPLLQKFLGF